MNRTASTLRIPLGGTLADRALLSVFFFLATVLGAYVEIPLPFTPVPVTLQTLFVLLAGAWLGRNWALGVQSAYLGAGALGVSVFAGAASGLFTLSGPTAGYLWAFLPAALLVGTLWEKVQGRSAALRLGLFASGGLLILAVGTLWLALLLHLSFAQAMFMGFLPFLPGEVVKTVIALAAAPRPR